MTTGFWQQGDCYYCLSAFSVVWIKKLHKRVCEKCGRDSKGQVIERGPPPKTRKAYLRPSATNDLKILKTSQREQYGDFKIRIPSEPKRKPINFFQCPDCPQYTGCKTPCHRANTYANQDYVGPYPVLAATVPEVEGGLDDFLASPEGATNSELDNIYIYSTDDECSAKVYKTKPRTPYWAWLQPAPVWVLYMYFKMRLGVREIARRLDLSPGRVSRIVKKHRVVLQNHLVSVLLDDRSRSYFFEKYFNQLTVKQVAEKYKVSHQAVSKSIRRTGKIIVKSLQFSVAFSQSMSGGLLFFQDGNNLVLTQQKKLLFCF